MSLLPTRYYVCYLGIEWIQLELINTLQSFGIDLLEGDPIFDSFKDVNFLHDIKGALREVSLPGDCHLGLVPALGRLLVLRVGEHYEWYPQPLYLLSGQTVEGPLLLEVVVLESVVVPDHQEPELEHVDQVHLGDAEHVHHRHRDVHIDRDNSGGRVIEIKRSNLLVVVILHHQHSAAVLV